MERKVYRDRRGGKQGGGEFVQSTGLTDHAAL